MLVCSLCGTCQQTPASPPLHKVSWFWDGAEMGWWVLCVSVSLFHSSLDCPGEQGGPVLALMWKEKGQNSLVIPPIRFFTNICP